MQFTVTNDTFLDNIIKDYIKKLKFPFNISIESVKQMKTKKQLEYFWGGLAKVLSQYYFSLGESESENKPLNPQLIKLTLYDEVGIYEPVRLLTGRTTYRLIPMSEMTKEQMCEFISRVLDWIDNLDPVCIIPPDLRLTWLLHVTDEDIARANKYKFPERNSVYLAYIRKQSCLYSGKYGCEAAHISLPGYGGMSQKAPDWMAISLHSDIHRKAHQEGHSFIIEGLNLYGFDIETYCKLAYLRWLYKK